MYTFSLTDYTERTPFAYINSDVEDFGKVIELRTKEVADLIHTEAYYYAESIEIVRMTEDGNIVIKEKDSRVEKTIEVKLLQPTVITVKATVNIVQVWAKNLSFLGTFRLVDTDVDKLESMPDVYTYSIYEDGIVDIPHSYEDVETELVTKYPHLKKK